MLADENPLPDGELKDFSEKQRELRKTEFDVRDATGSAARVGCKPVWGRLRNSR
jgi:hypothetical protein